jgi:acetoin:2,6-dichlorophenolindophenol oxidoreductase subunit alpha
MTYDSSLQLNLYRTMLRIRLCEESLVPPISAGDIQTPCHLYSGQEAIAAGICASLNDEDYVFGSHRSHGHFLAKGGDMKAMVAEIYCRETGCSRGRGGSMHLIDPEVGMLGSAPIVAGTISLATGAALASSIRQDGRVAVSFFGDGATGEGVLYESLNFAALRKLPILFVCENNLYSTHMPICECRVGSQIQGIGQPFGVDALQVDGNDVLAIYEAGKMAIDKCRKGQGPVFIECLTYRFRGHVGPDDNVQGCHTDIRPKEEFESWLKKDPIVRFEEYLVASNLTDRNHLTSIRQETEEEILEAGRFAVNSGYPEPVRFQDYIFAHQIEGGEFKL